MGKGKSSLRQSMTLCVVLCLVGMGIREYYLSEYMDRVNPRTISTAEANELLKKASNGDATAQNSLGIYYSQIERYGEAAKWYQISADNGNEVATYNLGLSYRRAEGVGKDLVRAVELFQESADEGYSDAMVMLAMSYEYGDGVAANDASAIYWYCRAVERDNHPVARNNLLAIGHRSLPRGFGNELLKVLEKPELRRIWREVTGRSDI